MPKECSCPQKWVSSNKDIHMARRISRTTAVDTYWLTTMTFATFLPSKPHQSLKSYWLLWFPNWEPGPSLSRHQINIEIVWIFAICQCVRVFIQQASTQGWQSARLCTRWRDIWMHASHPWPQGAHTLGGKAEDRGEIPVHRVGAGHCTDCEMMKAWIRHYFCSRSYLEGKAHT